eukprot:6196747-Pleurochrysis_carterae.AAC.1
MWTGCLRGELPTALPSSKHVVHETPASRRFERRSCAHRGASAGEWACAWARAHLRVCARARVS